MPYLNLKGKWLVAAITLSSGMGFILFGYDNGVLGSVVTAPPFVKQFKLNSTMVGTVTAMYEVGCIFGCWAVAFFGERFGRKRIIHVGTVFICIGAAIQSTSNTVAQLIAGRVVAGIGMGLITSTVSVWQAETSPPSLRGLTICSSLSCNLTGQLIAYWSEVGTAKHSSSFSWRFPFAFQAVLALLTSTLLCFMPESPRWLLKHGRDDEAVDVLNRLRDSSGEGSSAAREAQDIRAAIVYESSVERGWREIFKEDAIGTRWRVALCLGVQSMQPFSGSGVISYYQTYIFQNSVGLPHAKAQLMAGYLNIWFLGASFLTWYLVERVGRRPLFLIFCLAMSAAMTVLAGMVEIGSHNSGIVAATAIFCYEGFFTWGWMGNLWAFSAEILPLGCRSRDYGFAVGCQWIFKFVMVYVTPIGIHNIGWRMYIIYAVFNLSFFPILYFTLPETQGLSLELVDSIFMDKSANPVKKAAELRKKIKRGELITATEEFEAAIIGDGGEKGMAEVRLEVVPSSGDK